MIVVDGVERVDVQEAAALAGRSPETVRRWVWSGRQSVVAIRDQDDEVTADAAQVANHRLTWIGSG